MSSEDHKVSKITSEAIFAVRPISSIRFLMALVFCLSLLLIDIRFNLSNEIRGYAHDVLLPLYKIVEVPSQFINKASEIRQSNQQLKKNLLSYKEDNEKLKLINSQLKDLTKRNQELNLVWNSAQIDKEAYLLGQKMNLSSNPLKPALILDVNDPDSILEINQPVLSKEGIIGKVKSVGLRSAEVMISQDPQSLIPVISSTTRLHGILKGHGLQRKGQLINVKKTAAFKEGEDLYSSGLGKVFPPNYLVGRVVLIEDRPDNEFLNIDVEFLDLPEDQDYFLVFTK
ncbi:MAG TPA: rod shape-determining protein MreC [Gammaproteobacteria bacterium]|jgi:rod shape-determining protein MreC|nr:rod shape-determining protein MreC [Gammaproteobacteria bacterium]HIA44173.1 rod shape-determining protein MreC [Gammaproteobacteria bacterium]HIB74324.1 rod shape-determining protein MreC [Gammaproteobacteria bacterium]HIN74332.1 rod shape-determining protein MreC [Gammaproteobacteria bacterium]